MSLVSSYWTTSKPCGNLPVYGKPVRVSWHSCRHSLSSPFSLQLATPMIPPPIAECRGTNLTPSIHYQPLHPECCSRAFVPAIVSTVVLMISYMRLTISLYLSYSWHHMGRKTSRRLRSWKYGTVGYRKPMEPNPSCLTAIPWIISTSQLLCQLKDP